MEALAAGEGGVDERARQVQAPAGDLEHLLDEVTNLARGEHRRSELGLPVAGDEDLVGGVDPDLLDLVVVEVLLERAEAADGVHHGLGRGHGVGQRWHVATERAFVVGGDGVAHQCLQAHGVAQRVDAAAADQLADLVLEECDAFHLCPLVDCQESDRTEHRG